MSDRFTFTQPASTATTGGLAIFIACNTVLTGTVLVSLIRKRHDTVISHRNVVSLLFYLLYFYGLSTVSAISIIVGKPALCLATNIIMSLMFFFTCHFMLLVIKVVMEVDVAKAKRAGYLTYKQLIYNRYLKRHYYNLLITILIGGVYVVVFWAAAIELDYNFDVTSLPQEDSVTFW